MTLAQLEEQIFVVEGFRVKLAPLQTKTKSLPGYDFIVMAPQRWHISDWKNVRLAGYVTLLKSAVVLRGDGSPVAGNLQLGNVRDTYYAAKYGSIARPQPPQTGS